MRELGQDVYGFNAAIGLRVDPQDNVWTIDAAANQVVKFDSEGRVALVLGRKPETIACVRPAGGPVAAVTGAAPDRAAVRVAAPAARGRCAGAPAPGGWWRRWRWRPGRTAPGSGVPGSSFSRPTDVAWDRAGNIYVADGIGNNNRVAKFDKDGRFITHWGSTGTGPGQFNGVKALAIDAQGNVYVADAGNKRIQVFDAEGTFKSEFGNVGTPLAMCITRGIDAVPLHLARRRRRRHGGRGDLQGAARWQGGGQVRRRPASCRRSSASPTPSTAATRTSC